ncbi:AarF/ABC1/UbiB kinase family protein [uncultured Aquabacterium sp.]|uniref:ABC1 kinase family protein n=1 Tax=uncultured Aquabacterium sp. TaxID=158753 RepID=UPI0030CCE30B
MSTRPPTTPEALSGEAERSAPVPQGRTSRFLHLGRAVGEMALGAAAQSLSQLAQGQRPVWADVMLSADNARRLAERLSQMRGAAMKLGQLMSMDGQGVLPQPFADLLSRLRDQAHTMPALQLAEVLEREYGEGWHRRFQRFSYAPIAAASIGQVHRAETHEGAVLALKVQYPGVRRSIDSDVANLALLMRVPGLVPAGLDLAPLLEHVRQQLHHETDYLAEAQALMAYRQALGEGAADASDFAVPEVHAAHSTGHILALGFLDGHPLDRLTQPDQPQALRDRVATALCRLAIRELFEMRLVQTDPNFGNYLFDPLTQRIGLLDFGATQTVSPERVEAFRALARALRDDDVAHIDAQARAIGFIGEADTPAQAQGVIDLMREAGEVLRQRGPYDFGQSDLLSRLSLQGRAQLREAGVGSVPPEDLVFLQRKFVGTFLLCTRLRARVDVAALFAPVLDAA